jgi:hypothetical protein
MLDFNAPTEEEKAEIRRRKAAITRRIRREVLAEYGIDKLPRQGERTLITGAQGTGKSRSAAEAIAELSGQLVIWWLVPTLEKAQEQADEYCRLAGEDSMNALVVRGRGAPDPRIEGEAMCPRHLVVNRAAAMGVNVQEAICRNGCPLLTACGFQRQKKEMPETGLFVMASDYLWLPCPAPRHDLVIVDESILDKAAEVISFDPSRITEDDKWSGRELDAAIERRRIALLVRSAITEHPRHELTFLRESNVTVADIRRCLKHLATRDESYPQLSGQMSNRAIAAALDAVEAREILKVLKLFRQIRRELPLPRARLNSVWYEPDALVKVDGESERAPRVVVGYVKPPRLARETPVLALDGTGSLDLNRKIFGEQMSELRFAAPRDAEVVQVSSKVFSRQSLTGCNRHRHPISSQKTVDAARLRRQVIELLRLLPGQVLLVTYKQAEEVMLPELPPHVLSAHFGALRGLNSFEHCGTAVVMGREQPPAQAIEALTRPFCTTDAEPFIPIGDYVLQSRGRRIRNGGPNVVEVQVHPDHRCQAMLEQIREAEIVQAVDRVRPVFNRRRIIVLTSLALDITVDRAVPWTELRPDKFAHAFARHGVLPLSAPDLFKAFPDLWPTPKEAKNALHYWAKNTLKTPNKESIWRIQGVFLDPLTATYRRKNQRGPVARALVWAGLPDPRAVLEGLVGEVVEFQADRPVEPAAEASATAPRAAPTPLPPLPPLAAALSAETHLLASLPSDARPPDMLGMAGVMKLMALTTAGAGPERRLPHDLTP